MRTALAALVLVAACFKSGGSGGGAAPSNKAAAAGPDYSATLADPVGFLPIDSEIVFSLDAEQLRRSPVWTMLEPKLLAAAGSDLEMFRLVCGFDPVASVRGITLGIKNLKQTTPDGIIVVAGLDRERLVACMAKAQANDPSIQVSSGGVVTITPKTKDDTPVVFGFVDATTAVAMIGAATTPARFAAALAGGAPLRKSPVFVELLGRINLEASMWVVINGNSSVFEQAASLGVKPKAIIGSVKLEAGLDANLRVTLATPAEAQQITTMAQGQLGMAQGFFEKLEVTADAADVVVLGVMTDEQLRNVMSLLNGMMGGGGTTTP